jgi:uncharacterized protein YecE (DUF72 family)
MQLFTGTSGYSYKEWKGTFYPENLAASDMLRFYAERFPTVEINNTFYRMPKRDVLEKWSAEVPEQFTFVVKASQRITHIKRLKDVASEVQYLFETISVLGPKLGPVFFQLPPFSRKDTDRLRSFLETLPKDRPIAFEFRHASWFDDEIYTALRAHNVALCLADVEEQEEDKEEEKEEAKKERSAPPRAEPNIITTADWGYLRLRRCDYTDADLHDWIARIRAEPWKQAYVFFKHEDEATGPALAKRFIDLWSTQA